MKTIRRIYRLIALMIWFAISGTVAFFVNLSGGWRAVCRVSLITRAWGNGIARIMNMKVNIHGSLPDVKGALVVSNHTSYLDIIVHSSVFPIRFSPKIEIKHWPILGLYLAMSRPVWVDRTSKGRTIDTVRNFQETMRHDLPLIVYPEGTTSSGESILPFKSTPFQAAAEGDFPVIPVLTVYRNKNTGWYGTMSLLPHLWKMLAEKSFDVDLYVMPPIYPRGRGRKRLAVEIYEEMRNKYEQISIFGLPSKYAPAIEETVSV